ncbi:unnamed protein product [Vitrella brassicaformis CCMP3155]|uniref:Uncharacterized protein n=1 Tax=Vitrella brassicaformis (strain CCMP3155) TaxID=1169540 RepID=A0A0G4GJN8_VITBC|nr:unnamed protein product [Vitrella brassicaformis CCMP3155]|eukprot:CEM30135.1 unnamed protein product [Vitrella brassicaformis CCMP3155]
MPVIAPHLENNWSHAFDDLIRKTADDYHVRWEDYQERGGYDNRIEQCTGELFTALRNLIDEEEAAAGVPEEDRFASWFGVGYVHEMRCIGCGHGWFGASQHEGSVLVCVDETMEMHKGEWDLMRAVDRAVRRPEPKEAVCGARETCDLCGAQLLCQRRSFFDSREVGTNG